MFQMFHAKYLRLVYLLTTIMSTRMESVARLRGGGETGAAPGVETTLDDVHLAETLLGERLGERLVSAALVEKNDALVALDTLEGS